MREDRERERERKEKGRRDPNNQEKVNASLRGPGSPGGVRRRVKKLEGLGWKRRFGGLMTGLEQENDRDEEFLAADAEAQGGCPVAEVVQDNLWTPCERGKSTIRMKEDAGRRKRDRRVEEEKGEGGGEAKEECKIHRRNTMAEEVAPKPALRRKDRL